MRITVKAMVMAMAMTILITFIVLKVEGKIDQNVIFSSFFVLNIFLGGDG